MRLIFLGVLASFFFSLTFVLNREMSVSGGSWMWTASLRYLFMIPFLFAIVWARGGLPQLFSEMGRAPGRWILWSLVGFGLFYAPLCFAAQYSPAWLVAGAWQFTILAGGLLTPFFYGTVREGGRERRVRRRLPLPELGVSSIILAGILLMEASQAGGGRGADLALGAVPVAAAAIAYPLGNRKMMELCGGRVDAYQRTLGMTLASLPLWIVLSVLGVRSAGWPGAGQIEQSAMVAVSSGVIATVLFFAATDRAQGNERRLAAVEATQSAEVVFTLAGSWILFPGEAPSLLAMAGAGTVVAGMVAHSLASRRLRESAATGTDGASVGS